jgi:hypothetical protein
MCGSRAGTQDYEVRPGHGGIRLSMGVYGCHRCPSLVVVEHRRPLVPTDHLDSYESQIAEHSAETLFVFAENGTETLWSRLLDQMSGRAQNGSKTLLRNGLQR